MDLLREVWLIRGDEAPTMGLLRCEKVSVQRGSAVTPTGIRCGLVEDAAVWGREDMVLELAWRYD